MTQVVVEVRGLDKLQKMADKFPAITQKHIDKAIVRSIGEIEIKTKPITPVKTGVLRNSMIPVFKPFVGTFGARNVAYASKVHDMHPVGTPYFNPSKNKTAVAGFLAVGAKQAEATINEAFATAINDIVRELAK